MYLRHYNNFFQEDNQCPGDQVIDIWGYCRSCTWFYFVLWEGLKKILVADMSRKGGGLKLSPQQYIFLRVNDSEYILLKHKFIILLQNLIYQKRTIRKKKDLKLSTKTMIPKVSVE